MYSTLKLKCMGISDLTTAPPHNKVRKTANASSSSKVVCTHWQTKSSFFNKLLSLAIMDLPTSSCALKPALSGAESSTDDTLYPESVTWKNERKSYLSWGHYKDMHLTSNCSDMLSGEFEITMSAWCVSVCATEYCPSVDPIRSPLVSATDKGLVQAAACKS